MQSKFASLRRGLYFTLFLLVFGVPWSARAEDLLAAVLPNARTVSFGAPATAFATALNISGRPLTGCGPSIPGVLPGTFGFRPTNPSTNLPSGPEGQLVNIPTGGSASFVFSFTANQVFSSRTFPIVLRCGNAVASRTTAGVITFTLGVSDFSPPDVIAIAQTLSQDGIVKLPGAGGTTPFVAAAINIGGDRSIVVRPEISGIDLPLTLSICESNAQAQCLASPTPSVTVEFPRNAAKTFTIYVEIPAGSPVPFDPAINRIALKFSEDGVVRANSSVAVATNGAGPPAPDPEGEGGASPVILALENVNPNGFAAANAPVQFAVAAGSLNTAADSISIWINDEAVAPAQMAVTASRITLSSPLNEGRNDIRITAYDTDAGWIDQTFTIWAGNYSLTADVRNAAGSPVANARVQFRLNEDDSIFVQLLTDAQGMATVTNIPGLPINVYAYAPNLQDSASASIQGWSGGVVLSVRPLDPPSSINNSNFELGTTAGWVVSPGATIVPHAPGADANAPSAANSYDLRISTNQVMTKQVARRTITVPAGTGPNVTFKLRHQFVTEEVPGGYCGSEFNDAFGVEARIVTANGTVLEPKRIVSSMNELGCSAFDANGATGWLDFSVSVPRGAKLEVEAFVQNVGDPDYQSYLVVDGLEASTLVISELTLRDLGDKNLEKFGVSTVLTPGVTRLLVRGTLLVKRAEPSTNATIQNIVLRVKQGNREVIAELSSEARTHFIGKTVPASNGLEWNSNTKPLFIIPHASLGGWDTGNEAQVSLEAELTPSEGEVSKRSNAPKKTLKVVTRSSNITIGRVPGAVTPADIRAGGDDWAMKSTLEFLETINGSATYNDMSKMHAGYFYPHSLGGRHTQGSAIDMKLPGFPTGLANSSHKDGDDADALIDFYNDYSGNIVQIGTTFPTSNTSDDRKLDCKLKTLTSAFYIKIRDAGLLNKIKCWDEHPHFHVDVIVPPAATTAQDMLVSARKRGFRMVGNRP